MEPKHDSATLYDGQSPLQGLKYYELTDLQKAPIKGIVLQVIFGQLAKEYFCHKETLFTLFSVKINFGFETNYKVNLINCLLLFYQYI